MAAKSVCCCFSGYRCATTWAAALGLVQALILVPLSIVALLLEQQWEAEGSLSSVSDLLYIYYFYNPNGDNRRPANALAFRTQILSSVYVILTSIWLILSIALLSTAHRRRGSPWAHYTWGTITAGVIVVDLVSSLLYGRDIIVITGDESLQKETGYPVKNAENEPRLTFAIAPLIMLSIFSKGILLWVINIVFTFVVFKSGKSLAHKRTLLHSSRYQDNAWTVARSLSDRQPGAEEPADNAIVTVPRIPSSVSTNIPRSATPEHSQQLKKMNEELNARLHIDSSPRNPQRYPQRDRARRRPVDELSVSESFSRPSSRQMTPEVSPGLTNPPAFGYHEPSRLPPRRPRQLDDSESGSTWVESPQSPLRKDASPSNHPDTWWVPPHEDEPLRRPPQLIRSPVSELRAQLPWSYFQTPLDPVAIQSTPPSNKRSSDISKNAPIIPAPDYNLNLQRGRHRSSTRELRDLPVESNEGLARSVSDVGKRLPYSRSPNVYGAPFAIMDASSRSPHFLRRPTEYDR